MTNPDALQQLVPTGKLRGGIVVSPAASAFFAIRDGQGEVRGVTVDLMQAFAAALKLPLALQVYDNSGQVTDAWRAAPATSLHAARCHARNESRFRPAYYLIASTYLCRPARPSNRSTRSPAGRTSAFPTPPPCAARRTAPNAAVEEVPSRTDDRDGAQPSGRCLRAVA